MFDVAVFFLIFHSSLFTTILQSIVVKEKTQIHENFFVSGYFLQSTFYHLVVASNSRAAWIFRADEFFREPWLQSGEYARGSRRIFGRLLREYGSRRRLVRDAFLEYDVLFPKGHSKFLLLGPKEFGGTIRGRAEEFYHPRENHQELIYRHHLRRPPATQATQYPGQSFQCYKLSPLRVPFQRQLPPAKGHAPSPATNGGQPACIWQ